MSEPGEQVGEQAQVEPVADPDFKEGLDALTDAEMVAVVRAVRVGQVARILDRDLGVGEERGLEVAWGLDEIGLLATPDADQRASSWFREEYERAKARNALIPPHARMVVTDPTLSAHKRGEDRG